MAESSIDWATRICKETNRACDEALERQRESCSRMLDETRRACSARVDSFWEYHDKRMAEAFRQQLFALFVAAVATAVAFCALLIK